MKPGKDFERLMFIIEKALADKENITVEPNKKLKDKDTGRMVEFDVIITYDQGHRKIVAGIECRDRSRRVQVDAVAAYSNKCRAANINYPIIASSKGFAKTAEKKATALGIQCLDIAKAESVNWMRAPGFSVFQRIIEGTNIDYILEEGAPSIKNYIIVDKEGNEISQKIINNRVFHDFDKIPLTKNVPGKHGMEINITPTGFFAKDTKTNAKYSLKKIRARIRFTLEEHFGAWEFFTSTDVDKNKKISDTAVAKIKTGPLTGEMVFANDGTGDLKIVFYPDTTKKKKK